MRLSTLAMYDRIEIKAANHEFYSRIMQELMKHNINAPKNLGIVKNPLKFWASKDLFFSQTCGLPYNMFLHHKVTLIGTPDYGIEGCKPGYYNSVFVVTKENSKKTVVDFINSKFACNEYYSQSGWAAPQGYLKNLKLKFNNVILSGSHRNSAKLVSEGKADITAIDATSFRLIKEYDNFSKNLSIIDKTKSTPGLPFIAHKGADKKIFYEAVETAIKLISPKTRKILHIKGIVTIPKSEYLRIELPTF